MTGLTFGEFFKERRIAGGQTLREFCLTNGFDPGNISRIERGRFAPPQNSETLEKYAKALGIENGSDQWIEFCDLAAASGGKIPSDLMDDKELLAKLPVLFRTLRGSPVPAEKLDELIELVRKS
jgi:transcriptional regulator with XRE-family HTH domain